MAADRRIQGVHISLVLAVPCSATVPYGSRYLIDTRFKSITKKELWF
jgi:hypothetical protein